jgi:phosphate transport system permease protein
MQDKMTVTTKGIVTSATSDVVEAQINLRKRPHIRESLIQGFLFLCGALSILTTIGIVYGLGKESLNFFTRQLWEDTNKQLVVDIDTGAKTFELSEGGKGLQRGEIIRISDEVMRIVAIDGNTITVERGLQGAKIEPHNVGNDIFISNKVSLVEFFTHTKWNPQIGDFGILPLVNATLMTSAFAMIVALPLGLSVAIYLSEYASERARSILKPILEILAGIPTVVYGYFALTFMTPLLRSILGVDTVEIYNTASAGIVIGILILPLVSSMSEDALSAVPRSLREAAYGLGATKLETAVTVIVPAALSGITAAFIVAISRAIGETMIVAIAAGAGSAFTLNPFKAAETMTGHIVRISGGDISYDSIDYNSIFAIGLMLFFMTLSLNIISQRIVRRFREVYE